jgi:DNA modification methylase
VITLLNGDAVTMLRTLPDESVNCVVTSPPYWGLRDYGVGGQIGLEQSLGEHIDALVGVFREVRRVLRKDGTLWLNYGDAYASAPNGRSQADSKAAGSPDDRTFRDKPISTVGPVRRSYRRDEAAVMPANRAATPELKSKDRMLLPARVAIALQEDGWWVRDEIIWHKPNPMPISVRDRTTPAHEMVYMLSKSARYYYDQEAIKEPIAESSRKRLAQPNIDAQKGGPKQDAYEDGTAGQPTNSRRPNDIVKSLAAKERAARLNNYDEKLVAGEKWGARHEGWAAIKDSVTTRNKRSVWSLPTKSFPEAHFATFPPDLIRPMILAGCPVGGVVLDPFGGAGTTGLVADELGRDAILIELSPAYCAIIRKRLNLDALPKPEVQPDPQFSLAL